MSGIVDSENARNAVNARNIAIEDRFPANMKAYQNTTITYHH